MTEVEAVGARLLWHASSLTEVSSATWAALCNELVSRNNTRRDSQLAIQRASERGRVITGPDWMLTLAHHAAAA